MPGKIDEKMFPRKKDIEEAIESLDIHVDACMSYQEGLQQSEHILQSFYLSQKHVLKIEQIKSKT